MKQLLLVGMHQIQTTEQLDSFIKVVEFTVNQKVFKRTGRPINDKGGWRVPLTLDRKNLDQVNLSNMLVRNFEYIFGVFIKVCTNRFNLKVQSKWMEIGAFLKQVENTLDSKKEFLWNDMFALQGLVGMTGIR